jgi:hypothetical protein
MHVDESFGSPGQQIITDVGAARETTRARNGPSSEPDGTSTAAAVAPTASGSSNAGLYRPFGEAYLGVYRQPYPHQQLLYQQQQQLLLPLPPQQLPSEPEAEEGTVMHPFPLCSDELWQSVCAY